MTNEMAEVVRSSLQDIARTVKTQAIEWQELEDKLAADKNSATTDEARMEALLGQVEARGSRRALEVLADALFTGIADTDGASS